jgi:SAM-dependent methyltransferase
MDQTKIWDHFQNSDQTEDVFINALPRYEFLAKYISSGMTALNIGVGRGGLESILIKNGADVFCLDPSEETIEKLRTQYNLDAHAQVGFSQDMPFNDSQFDVVIMSEVLEHLSDDVLSATIIEVKRVLKPGGIFIGTVPANENLIDNQVVCPHCGVSFHRWGHTQSFTLLRLRNIFSGNKFIIRTVETRAFPSWKRSGLMNFFKSSIRYTLGRFGVSISSPHIFFEAQKA